MTHRSRILLGCLILALPVWAGFNVSTLQRSSVPTVLPGIDVLLSDSARLIAGQRLGLITNQTGVDARGVSTIDRLWSATTLSGPRSPVPGPRLVALFAPEHGIRGGARPGEIIGDSTDRATGLPIYSLYGTNRAPTAEQLAGLDVLIVDMQDVGARTFTYVSTMVLAMRAARAAGKRIVVLDRPNPIGCAMQGPVLDTTYASFIGMLPIPLRHGMTMGELARFANAELHIGADLVVVPVTGWRRCQWFDATGLPWVRPSPNLPDLQSVAWYPGVVLFEATNLSVGRGSGAPFSQVGAPWLQPGTIAGAAPFSRLARSGAFTPSAPGDGKYPNRAVQGIQLRADRARQGDVVEVALWLMMAVARAHPDSFTVDSVGLARRLGRPFDPRAAATQCRTSWDRCPQRWQAETDAFRRRARPYFLYR